MGEKMDFEVIEKLINASEADIRIATRILHPDTSIDTLEEIKYYNGFNGNEAQIEALNEASILACAVLELRIPKDVFWDTGYPCCPTCGVGLSDTGEQFCWHCGQKINWFDDYEITCENFEFKE